MFVKICGTTTLPDAELAIASGADAVGFVFAPSKRRVSVGQAAEMTSQMPEGIDRVGVFCAPDADEILHAVQEAGLTAVQLHMAQDSRLLAILAAGLGGKAKIWQVVSFEIDSQNEAVAEQSFLQAVLAAMLDERISAVLLDTSKAGGSGGTGESFPWQRAAPLVRRAEEMARLAREDKNSRPARVIVAGGLSARNVVDAIRVFEPWGVDCVSGVEAEPGRKDRDRLEAFVKAARSER